MTTGKRGGRKKKYVVTPEVEALLRERYDSKVRGRTCELAEAIGWPVWAVKKAASRLGLARPWPKDRRDWTPEEENLLRGLVGQRTVRWIARRLGRGETSCVLKIKRLGLSRRCRHGYSAQDLSRVMGVDVKAVTGWIGRGLLAARKMGSLHPNDPWVIEPMAILRFLKNHRWQYRLDKVDQDWFLDMVFTPIDWPEERQEEMETLDELAESRRLEPEVYLPTPDAIRAETARIRAAHLKAGQLDGWQNTVIARLKGARA
jgi:hypothetical protein